MRKKQRLISSQVDYLDVTTDEKGKIFFLFETKRAFIGLTQEETRLLFDVMREALYTKKATPYRE